MKSWKYPGRSINTGFKHHQTKRCQFHCVCMCVSHQRKPLIFVFEGMTCFTTNNDHMFPHSLPRNLLIFSSNFLCCIPSFKFKILFILKVPGQTFLPSTAYSWGYKWGNLITKVRIAFEKTLLGVISSWELCPYELDPGLHTAGPTDPAFYRKTSMLSVQTRPSVLTLLVLCLLEL